MAPPRSAEEGYTLNEDLADHAIAWIRQHRALVPDQPFFAYYATGGTHAPHHVPAEWREKYAGKFDEGWDKLREADLRPTKGARRGSYRRGAVRATRGRSLPGTTWTRRSSRCCAARWRTTRAFSNTPTITWAGSIQALDDLGALHETLDLLHYRRQRRFRRGHAERLVQRVHHGQWVGGDGDVAIPDGAPRSGGERKSRTRTTQSDGRTRWTRPTNGPSRWLRILVGCATARSCIGRRGSKPRARCAASSHT
jgi:hypothetical protein